MISICAIAGDPAAGQHYAARGRIVPRERARFICAAMRHLFMLLVCLLWWNHGKRLYSVLADAKPLPVSSQSRSGDLQCVTLAIDGETALDVSPGTVCFHCVFEGVVATDAVFEINSDDIDPNVGTVVNGTLVVFDSEHVFSTITITLVSCKMLSDNLLIAARVYLKSKL